MTLVLALMSLCCRVIIELLCVCLSSLSCCVCVCLSSLSCCMYVCGAWLVIVQCTDCMSCDQLILLYCKLSMLASLHAVVDWSLDTSVVDCLSDCYRIPYYLSFSCQYPGKFLLSYLPRKSTRHEFVTVTPEGIRYRSRTFPALASMIRWFKEHFRDPIPGQCFCSESQFHMLLFVYAVSPQKRNFHFVFARDFNTFNQFS